MTTKTLGDKNKWQATSLDIYGQVLEGTKITPVDEDASLPLCPGMVLLENLPHYKQVPHLINVAGIVVDIQVPIIWLEYCFCSAALAIECVTVNSSRLGCK